MLALLCLAVTGCALRRPPEVTRQLAGEPTAGHFVPPYAYEMYTRGELALAKGRPREAAQALELALAAPELDPYVLSRLALALHLSGSTREARARLAEAEKLSGCTAEVWMVRGHIRAAEDDLPGALEAYQRALECRPGHAEAQRQRLATLAAMGATARVRALSEQAEDSALPPPVAREAALRDAITAGDLEAIRLRLPPAELAPHLPWDLRARALSRLGEHDAAARAWLRAAPLAPADLPEAALAMARAGYWPEAGAAADAALARGLDEEQTRAMHAVRAGALYAEGQTRAAVEALPPEATATLPDWLERAGAPGLAAEVERGAQ